MNRGSAFSPHLVAVAALIMLALVSCASTSETRTSSVAGSGVGVPVADIGLPVTTGLSRTPFGAQEAAQPARPRPYPVPEPPEFARAVQNRTRTRTGMPGEAYWTQHASYTIAAELDPVRNTVAGSARVVYQNRSPNVLRRVAFHVYPNLFAPNAMRNRIVPVSGGADISQVSAQGRSLRSVPVTDTMSTGYSVGGTIMWITLPTPVAAGGSAEFAFDWSFVVPPDGAPRTGTDGDVFFVAYWYPQIAVYDDISGWHTDQYMGNAEFHMGFADYDVAITVPEGWLVGATGELRNAAEVLSEAAVARLNEARTGRTVVSIVGADDRGAGRATARGMNGKLTWRYSATNVRDFAWGTSANYLWDATGAVAGDVTGDGNLNATLIHSLYRPEKVDWAWDKSARYGQHSVEFLSAYLWPYPWPHMTVVDGPVSCGGMEYPMITCIGGMRDTLSLYSVTVHEIAHMWFPMQVASDEKRHSWMDEGLTRFNQAQAMRLFFGGYNLEDIARDRYLDFARTGGEVELMRHGDLYPVGSRAFAVASYDKKSTVMTALRGLLGTNIFMAAYREYGRRWRYKHPTPNDLFNTFNDVSGMDLSWFWRSWHYETWVLDQGLGNVSQRGGEIDIEILDLGLVPMPVLLGLRYADGTEEIKEVSVDPWLTGARRFIAQIGVRGLVERVEIDPERRFPDINRSNQVWTRR